MAGAGDRAEDDRAVAVGGWVDQQQSAFAHSCLRGQVERTVAEALVLFDPDEAKRRREAAEDSRRFDVHLGGMDTTVLTGTVEVTGTLDLADALDLDRAVTRTAAQLKELGSLEGLQARRAVAVGEIARAQLALDHLPRRPHRLHRPTRLTPGHRVR